MDFDIDDFEIENEDEMIKAREKFIEEQEEVEASNECEGGGCIL